MKQFTPLGIERFLLRFGLLLVLSDGNGHERIRKPVLICCTHVPCTFDCFFCSAKDEHIRAFSISDLASEAPLRQVSRRQARTRKPRADAHRTILFLLAKSAKVTRTREAHSLTLKMLQFPLIVLHRFIFLLRFLLALALPESISVRIALIGRLSVKKRNKIVQAFAFRDFSQNKKTKRTTNTQNS
jgi:hypothetical protein